jgi:photosystem II stability/assembly factor-like uncharacterized protein
MRPAQVRWRTATVAILLVTDVVLLGLILADAASATPEPEGVWARLAVSTTNLEDVSCVDDWHCVAVGGSVLWTSDAGRTWHAATTPARRGVHSVSCPTSQVCYGVNNSGEVVKTSDGGRSWWLLTVLQADSSDISCPTADDCFTDDGFESHDGGNSWRYTIRLFGRGIECPSSSLCYVAGPTQSTHGQILANRGNGWVPQVISEKFLTAISCRSEEACVAVGGGGYGTNILRTTDGQRWTVEYSTVKPENLFDVSCPTLKTCFAVNGTASVIATRNGGRTWSRQSTATTGWLFGISCPSPRTCIGVGGSMEGGVIVRYQLT